MDTWLSPTFWQEIISQTVAWIITTLPSLLIIFVMAFLALKLTNIFLHRLKPLMIKHMESGTEIDTTEMEKRIDTLLKILRSMIKIIVWLMIGMLILRKIGIDIAPIIAGAGIVGLAIGFGAQELVRDFISGFFMLLENQIRNGDVAIINGTGGLVEHVGMRTIVLRDLSGVVHIFQNGKINTLSNMTKNWSGMVFDIGVAYKEDTDRVVDVIQQVADEQRADPDFKNKILEPIEIFGVDQFGDSAVVIKARFKTKPIEQWAVGREFRRRLKKAFDDQGIEIPFPHRTVYWGEEIKPLQIKTCRSPVK
ncbi:MAG: mechanosensitive ion channel family protein [Desulfobulbaceae bacterium]|jgi:small-conductance mechanosensitive channel|nr:mechanosensitive ion channel family protein [Desulfobulbaceae bacterium]MDH3995443.1 mechanosensitive ion channel family protein [Desulfobulbaceae bacterium]